MSSKKTLLDYFKPSISISPEINSDNLLIYTLTYNIYGQMPSKEDIPHLFPNLNELKKFDIYIISTQECLQTASIFTYSKAKWETTLQEFLGENYLNVINQNLGAIHLSIFIKQEKLINFNNFRSGEIKTGFMNIFANKGAVSASMKYLDKNILFIGCHLAAGQNNAAERNNDLLRVSKSLKTSINMSKKEEIFSIKKKNLSKSIINKNINNNNKNINIDNNNNNKISKSVLVLNQNQNKKEEDENKKFLDDIKEVESNKGDDKISNRIKNTKIDDDNIKNNLVNEEDDEYKLIDDYDFAILSGDLNYRLNILQEDIEEIMNQKNPEILWDKDQLNNEIKKENKFEEGLINFMPTYKYKKNSDEYDYKRIPAWTDRILFKSKKKYDIMLCEYNSIQNINISDHKSVYAIFKINFKNRKKNDNIYNINYEINNINNDKKCILF